MSTKLIFTSERLFQVRHYKVSHCQLLLRSNKDSSSSTRLEILFENVSFMSIQISLKGIVITECSAAKSNLPAVMTASEASLAGYRIEADAVIGFIAATTVVTSEDALDYWDSVSLLLEGL